MQLKKPRSDSKLDALDLDQQRQLTEWLLTPGLSYTVVKKLVFEQFNTSTSGSALTSFYKAYCLPYLEQRRLEALGLAKGMTEAVVAEPGTWDTATIDALKQTAFLLASNPQADPKEVKAVFSLVLKARDQDLQLRRVQVLEKRETDAKNTLGDGSLSAVEKEAKMKAVFGLA